MRFGKLPSLVLALVISFQFLLLPQTAVANPLVIGDTGIGGLYANCTHVQLPDADVNIHIKYLGESTFDVSVTGRFTVFSNVSQTSMLAFAYPASWAENDPSDLNETFDILQFNIAFDGVQLTTWNFEWENASWIPEVDYRWDILSLQPAYVGFNIELESNTNHTLDVATHFRRTTDRDRYILSYIYASAQTFEGYVTETITIVVEEYVPLLEVKFVSEVLFEFVSNRQSRSTASLADCSLFQSRSFSGIS